MEKFLHKDAEVVFVSVSWRRPASSLLFINREDTGDFYLIGIIDNV